MVTQVTMTINKQHMVSKYMIRVSTIKQQKKNLYSKKKRKQKKQEEASNERPLSITSSREHQW